MPKLSKAKAQAASQVESQPDIYEPLPAGLYRLRLLEVDGSKKGAKGPYWAWTFKIEGTASGEATGRGRKVWVNTSLSDDALWKMKEVYDALGFTLDSDTDEMCGSECLGRLAVTTIKQGTRAGELTNECQRLDSLDSDAAADADDDDGFDDDGL